jgi:prenyltransferase beta subunit
MYDHAMGAIAVSEAAYMTSDARYQAVALKAADFIVAAQREETGGWQYAPGEFGDTSVTGWCLMALHSAERVGYPIPPRTSQAAMKWLERVTAPGDSLLAGYQNRSPATPSMTAKNVFCRILLGDVLSPRAVKEASDFIASMPPGTGDADYYYWYYASLSLMQLQNDGWTRWNLRLRDYLLRSQRRDGDGAGSWDADGKWTDRGGRVYCTAMATLTLEVYYRYLPMYAVRANAAVR